jgi:hypothetical protein
LHAQVDSWNSTAQATQKGRPTHGDPDDLWRRVMRLEKTCRNPKPTALNSFAGHQLVQLQAPVYATSFEELLNVLGS